MELVKYRFFGTNSEILGVNYTQYGQIVELDREKAEAAIAEHPPALLVPDDVWSKIPDPITEEELADFPSALIHGEAPAEFVAKTKAVREAAHEFREGLIAAKPAAA